MRRWLRRRTRDGGILEPSRQTFGSLIAEAAAAVTQRPVRTLLTALGTILGVGAFVATTGVAETARAQVSSRFDVLKATEVRVQDSLPDGNNPFPADVSARLGRLNGVNHAGLSYTVPDNGAIHPRTSPALQASAVALVPVIAADPGTVEAAIPTLQTGRLYDEFHQERAERVALVGRAAARQLGITRVDNQPAVFLGDIAYTVIGILDDVRRNPDLLLSVVIPTSAANRDLPSVGATYEVLIDTEAGAASLISRQAPIALRPSDPTRLAVLVPPDPKNLRNQVSGDVTDLFFALSGLSLLIGTVAIANATLLSIVERRPEIGLRRALGARRSHIRRQVTVEAGMVGAVGGVIGTCLALVAITLVAAARGWTATVDPTTILVSPVIGLATGALAGLLPAIKASRTLPAEALRS